MPVVLRSRRSQQPRNNSSLNAVRNALDSILPLATRQYDNAIAINGYPVLYYRKRNTGLRCSCCGGAESAGVVGAPKTLAPGVTVLEPDGTGTADFVQSMLHGSVFAIQRYGSRQFAVDANGGDNYQRAVPNSPLIHSRAEHHKTTDMDDPFAEQIEPGSPEDLFDVGTEHNIEVATATTGCGVCLGTTWVGGYDPLNQVRMVYDTQAPWQGDITRDRTTLPNQFTFLTTNVDGNVARVMVMLPAGAVDLEAFRVFNNTQHIQVNARIRDRVTGELLPIDQIVDHCDGQLHELVLTFPSTVTAFTHLEIQLVLAANPVLVEWSRLIYSEDLAKPENLDNPNVIISPSVPRVSIYDLISESVYRKLWKVTTTNPAFDRERQITGWEATLRLMQTYELPLLLPRRRDRVHYTANQVVRQHQDQPDMHVYDPTMAHRGGPLR